MTNIIVSDLHFGIPSRTEYERLSNDRADLLKLGLSAKRKQAIGETLKRDYKAFRYVFEKFFEFDIAKGGYKKFHKSYNYTENYLYIYQLPYTIAFYTPDFKEAWGLAFLKDADGRYDKNSLRVVTEGAMSEILKKKNLRI